MDTPKFHILVNHTVAQVKWFRGIADLVEDFIERSHQTGKRLDHLTARMSSQCFRNQEMVKMHRRWMMSNPSVQNQIPTVKQESRRRNRNSVLPCKRFKKDIKKEEKTLKRDLILKSKVV